MSGQILPYLTVVAVVGSAVGWLFKQLQCRAANQSLRHELEEKRNALMAARRKAASLKADVADLRRRNESRVRRLESRILELEPLGEVVRRREATIRRLQDALRSAGADSAAPSTEVAD